MTAGSGIRQATGRALVALAALGCVIGSASAELTRSQILLDGDPSVRPSDSEEILLTQASPDEPTTEFGSAVATGDVNGDGLADVLVGQRSHNRVFVYLGSEVPRSVGYFDDPNAADIVIQAPAGGVDAVQQLGFSLAAADFDGDGIDDILAGAPFSDPMGRVDAGLAFVILGPLEAGEIDTSEAGDETTVFKLSRGGVARAGDLLGFAVGTLATPAGALLAVSARGAEAPVPSRRPAAGAVHVMRGSLLPSGEATVDLSLLSAVTFFGSDVSDAFGESLAACDVDGSGDEDLLVGSIFGDGPSNAGVNRGEVALFLGENITAGHHVGNESALSADLTIHGATDGDDLGYTVACGDLDGDGLGDMVASAIFADAAGEARPTAGEVYAFRGRASRLADPGNPLSRRILRDPATMSDQAPIDLDPAAPMPGRAGLTLLGATTADQLGFSLEVGDFDGDGFGDLIAGARRYDRDQTLINVGATYVIRGTASVLGPPAPPAPRTIDLRQGTARPLDPGFDPNTPIDHLPNQVSTVIVGASRNDHSSFDVAAGDLDGDFLDELFIGAIGDLTQTPGYPGEVFAIWFSDGDGDGASDVLDRDSDNDGLADEEEDANGDGLVGAGETDPFDQDTDGDGIQDGTERGLACVAGGGTVPCDDPSAPLTSTDDSLAMFFVPDADPSTESDPIDVDSDDDGLSDASEDPDADGAAGAGETEAGLADTDGDGIQDGTELGRATGTAPSPPYPGTDTGVFVPDADGGATVTQPFDADTDDDGLPDGWIDGHNPNGGAPAGPNGVASVFEGEDLDADGMVDTGETDPNAIDSDEDDLRDGVERGVMASERVLGRDGIADVAGGVQDGTASSALFDAQDSTVTDPLDGDSDDDGLPDGAEDVSRNGRADAGESDPSDADTDNDLIPDGIERGDTTAEPDTAGTFVPDADMGASTTDPTSPDTDGDGITDGVEDDDHNGAVEGDLDLDNDVDQAPAEIWTETDAADPDTDRDGLRDGIEDRNRDGAVQTGETDPLDQDTDDDGLPDGWIDGANGEPVDPNGPRTPLEGEDLDLDGDWGTAFGESDPRDDDSDNDMLPDGLEAGLPLEPTPAMGVPGRNGVIDDADGTDTASSGFKRDGDSGLSVTEPFDADTDDDGLPDGFISGHNPNGGVADDPNTISEFEGEDINVNGMLDAGETDPIATENDSDNDGVRDGVERGVMASERVLGPDNLPDAPGLPQDGTAPNALFDAQDTSLTDPLDGDSDDDGLSDGAEDDMGNGQVDAGETDPNDFDTDNDLLPDGLEEGVTEPLMPGTDEGAGHFIADADPNTSTVPTNADTDGGGVSDGEEDNNPRNGRVDSGERDPNDGADDNPGALASTEAADGPAAPSVPTGTTGPGSVPVAADGPQRGPITATAAPVPHLDVPASGVLSRAPVTASGLTAPKMVYNLYQGRLGLLGQTGHYVKEAQGCTHGDARILARREPLFSLVAAVFSGVDGFNYDGNDRRSMRICGP